MEYEEIMKKLIKKTMRMFYETHHAVIMDILLEYMIMYDNEICEKMKMLNKEFNRLVVKLKDDKLLKAETKIETKSDGRQLLRCVYFIVYSEIKDVIKYKIFKMSRFLEQEIKNTEKLQGYKCSSCFKEFGVLEAQRLLENFIFKCDECSGKLIENKGKTSIDDPHMLHSIMMNELSEVISMLKELDKHNIPSIDYFQVLALRKGKEMMKSSSLKSEYKICEIQEEEEKQEIFVENEEKNVELSFKVFQKQEESKNEVKEESSIFVNVNGVSKSFSQITEEDKEKMNEDEYEKYFEIFLKQNEAS
ncbi:putative subunit alpha of transcription initiation factor IIE [Hamiltosporidium tvaerminnensis]|uniref:Putative subunit alpha of transcription initiation factor IIE n=6 Tax=Hamiltosporidium TaxID=1176354 RepID=A0A4Q9M2K3_9MICR|nr:General transcription factor IIE subunit 1 [Hamiltosporidium tvaerminnensis]TBT98192.1 putative subunit alpha of transcription initiation factor IIE [Hamiltosporidium magnivora]TBU20964.1 putative subunit alpha of transcription initiation factor IIE [Hamiltosporidium tvaerminnensis]TBU21004.1 putative subunit alpha of transcription initiation factor IIE [Hamiltosporidium tvaerminnensis]